MGLFEKDNLSSRLPATPCTDEMRTRIIGIAKRNGVSVATVQRKAFELFLSDFESKVIKNDDTLSKNSEVS